LTGFASDLRDQLRDVTIPALIVHGDHDVQAPLEICGRKTARLVTQSTFLVYENAGHGLFVTHADRLNADLLEFVQARRSRAVVATVTPRPVSFSAS
jgi:non-heme chloroperoxidase